jgi:hypothetical protein
MHLIGEVEGFGAYQRADYTLKSTRKGLFERQGQPMCEGKSFAIGKETP